MIQSENDFTDSSTEKASIWTPRPKERERTRMKKEGDGPVQLEVVNSALTPFR